MAVKADVGFSYVKKNWAIARYRFTLVIPVMSDLRRNLVSISFYSPYSHPQVQPGHGNTAALPLVYLNFLDYFFGLIGRSIANSAPSPGSETQLICPPCFSTTI